MGDAVKKLLKECASKNNFTITEMESENDHIHLLVNYPPTQSVTNIVTRLKQYSTFHIWPDPLSEAVLRSDFWKERTFWSDGYFASSIGQASLATIQEYIRNQG